MKIIQIITLTSVVHDVGTFWFPVVLNFKKSYQALRDDSVVKSSGSRFGPQAPPDGLTIISNFSSKVSNIPFWPPGEPGIHMVNGHACRQKINP